MASHHKKKPRKAIHSSDRDSPDSIEPAQDDDLSIAPVLSEAASRMRRKRRAVYDARDRVQTALDRCAPMLHYVAGTDAKYDGLARCFNQGRDRPLYGICVVPRLPKLSSVLIQKSRIRSEEVGAPSSDHESCGVVSEPSGQRVRSL